MLEWALQMIAVLVGRLLEPSLQVRVFWAFVDNEMVWRNDLGEKDMCKAVRYYVNGNKSDSFR